MSQLSLNNRIVVEAHKTDKSLRSKVTNGFDHVAQKTGLVGLKVIMGTTLSNGTVIVPGMLAFVREEILHTAPWAQKALETPSVGVPFFILDQSVVEFIDDRAGELR